MKPGTRVRRIDHDNFPICKVGDEGTVVAEDEASISSFGLMSKYNGDMVLVLFDNPPLDRYPHLAHKATPNITRYLEVIS
jgi:hypothetical protein